LISSSVLFRPPVACGPCVGDWDVSPEFPPSSNAFEVFLFCSSARIDLLLCGQIFSFYFSLDQTKLPSNSMFFLVIFLFIFFFRDFARKKFDPQVPPPPSQPALACGLENRRRPYFLPFFQPLLPRKKTPPLHEVPQAVNFSPDPVKSSSGPFTF